MDFQDLVIFRTVVQYGSVTRAAEYSGFSQPAISRRIQGMERELGQSLLDRSTVPLRLAPAGRDFLLFANRVLDDWASLQEKVAGATDLRGTLQLASSSAPVDAGLPSWVGGFVAAHPRVEVRWLSLPSQKVEAAVQEHQAMLGFMGSPPKDEHLSAEVIGSDEIVLAVPATSSFEDVGTVCNLTTLTRIPLVQRAVGSGTRTTIEQALAHLGWLEPLRIVAEVDSEDALVAAVVGGWGAGFVSMSRLSHEDPTRVRAVRLQGAPVFRKLYMIWDDTALDRDGLARRFRQYLRDRCLGPKA